MSNVVCIVLIVAAGVGGFIAGASLAKKTLNPLTWFA